MSARMRSMVYASQSGIRLPRRLGAAGQRLHMGHELSRQAGASVVATETLTPSS